MDDSHRCAVLMTTTDSSTEAEALARSLVDARLAACVQLAPIVSHYVWEGSATRSEEILLLVKTVPAKVEAVIAYVETHHSYDTPEVLALPVEAGSHAYLRWIGETVTAGP